MMKPHPASTQAAARIPRSATRLAGQPMPRSMTGRAALAHDRVTFSLHATTAASISDRDGMRIRLNSLRRSDPITISAKLSKIARQELGHLSTSDFDHTVQRMIKEIERLPIGMQSHLYRRLLTPFKQHKREISTKLFADFGRVSQHLALHGKGGLGDIPVPKQLYRDQG